MSGAAPNAGSPPRAHAAAWRGFLGDLLALSLLSVLAMLIGFAAAERSGIDLEADGGLWLAWIAFLGMLLAWALLERLRPMPPFRKGAAPRAPMGQGRAVLWGLGFGLALPLAMSALEFALRSVGLGTEAANEAGVRAMLAGRPLAGMLAVGLAAPLVEELVLRRRLFGQFWRAGFPWTGVLVSGALFALLHEFAPDVGQTTPEWLLLMAQYLGAGALFAWLYLRTGRILAPIAAHALNNLVLAGAMLAGAA